VDDVTGAAPLPDGGGDDELTSFRL